MFKNQLFTIHQTQLPCVISHKIF